MTIQEFREAQAQHLAKGLARLTQPSSVTPISEDVEEAKVTVLNDAHRLDRALKESIRYLRSAQGDYAGELPETAARIEDRIEDLETDRRALAKEAK